ncbi:hypothetical protein AMATHDRAFT_137987 [Amanita thiersii Skay4041]|uniref:Integral membrane protein n=1 Tax=Amanita thiersii Skay4041 TaxID=703135 RepID=A0A2A9NXS7_9AGAR|nr:hypothetical protein AMATHDRAFT_137987 [Amanita thiersii Skay4041]
MSHPSTPPWPSLYNPGLEIIHIEHRSAVQNGAAYLYHPSDIFRFTFYWTLIFYAPLFLICGLFAFWNLTFPPSLRPYNLHLPLHLSSLRPEDPAEPRYKFKENERRSRFTFAFLVLLTFLAAGLAGAAISSAIVGFVAAGFFKAANYNMSTWIPFLLAVMHVLVGYLSLWPSIIDII